MDKITKMKEEQARLLERQMKRIQSNDIMLFKRGNELYKLQQKVKRDRENDNKNNFLALKQNLIKRYV